MSTRFVSIDRNTPLLLPPDLRDWVPADHLAQELKLIKVGQVTVSIDGTKIAANASKHAAVSYARADEQLAQLELEVEQTAAGAATGTTVYAALDKTSHHRSVADLEKKPEPTAPAPGASQKLALAG